MTRQKRSTGSLRERFLAILAGSTDTPTVLAPDLSYWLLAHPLPEGNGTAAVGAFHQRLGVMPYYLYGASQCGIAFPGVQVRTADIEPGRSATVWETPLGPLRKETTQLPASVTQAITRYPVQTPEDLGRLISLYRRGQVVRSPATLVSERLRLVEEYGGYGLLSVPRSPLPALVTDWAGVMNAVTLLADVPERCEEFFAVARPLCLEATDIIAAAAPALVHVCDNLTSDVYTPYFEPYLEPHYRGVLGRLHAAGVRVATHLDGTVRGLLPRLARVGFDAVEALTPMPVGDASAADMRALAGPHVVLWGGLPGAMFAPPWTWDQFREHVLEVMDAWRGTPYILGIADQLPPDGDIEFVRRTAALIETDAER